MLDAIELAKTAYETEAVVNIKTQYGDFVLMSAEDYQYFLGLKETQAVESSPELNQRLLDGMNADRSEFISREEAFADV